MKNTLFYLFVILICFNSCRTEENILEKNNSKEIVYSQKILDKDVDNVIQYIYYNNLNIEKSKNQYLRGEIEFRLRSNLIKYENGDRGIIYPVVKNKKVEDILLCILNGDDKKVNFFELKEKEYEETKNLFSILYNVNKSKLSKINFIARENKFCAELPEDMCRGLGIIPIDPVHITNPKKPVNPLFPEDLPVPRKPFKPEIPGIAPNFSSADRFISEN